MGIYKERQSISFADVKTHVDDTCGWRYVFDQLAGDSLAPAMQAKPNVHVDCPLPSHGGKNDFRLMTGWDHPGHRAGKSICSCQPKGLDGFNLLHQLGLYGSLKDTLYAVAAASGYLGDVSAPKPRPQPLKPKKASKGPDPDWNENKAKGRARIYAKLWGEAYRLDNPAAELGRRYLKSRGLDLPGVLPNIRFHPNMQVRTQEGVSYWPCLLFDISQPNGQRAGLHRIYLDLDGKKAPFPNPKRYTPFVPEKGYEGCAARVVTVDDCTTLNVSEGPENTLVAYHCTAETSWCVLDTSRMKSLKVPAFFKKVRIWADNDANGAGAIAAVALANRLLLEGFEVEVLMPQDEPGVDWNDLFVQKLVSIFSLPKRLPYVRWMADPKGLKIAA